MKRIRIGEFALAAAVADSNGGTVEVDNAPHRREAHPTARCHAFRAVSSRRQTRTHRLCRCLAPHCLVVTRAWEEMVWTDAVSLHSEHDIGMSHGSRCSPRRAQSQCEPT